MARLRNEAYAVYRRKPWLQALGSEFSQLVKLGKTSGLDTGQLLAEKTLWGYVHLRLSWCKQRPLAIFEETLLRDLYHHQSKG